MDNKENNFTVLKTHEFPIESSIYGKIKQLYQLCQDNDSKTHYYTCEVLDKESEIIGGRLIYEFKEPNKALEQWDNFINEDLDPSEYTVSKQEIIRIRKNKM